MAEASATIDRDFLNDRMAAFLLWQGPAIVMLIAAVTPLSDPTRGVIWGACLGVFGAGCLVNALRSSRRHCFLTGPFFLLMAAAALLHGFAVVSWGGIGWVWMGLAIITGTSLLFVPERLWGKYVGRETKGKEGCC